MKFRVTQPFIAFGKTTEAGDVVELTEEQAAALGGNDCIAEYETKVMPAPENKRQKKPSRSARPARVSRKKIAKKSASRAKK